MVYKYLLYIFDSTEVPELNELNNSKDLLPFVKSNSHLIIDRVNPDGFVSLDDAELFISVIHRTPKTRQVVAIYNQATKTWVKAYFRNKG